MKFLTALIVSFSLLTPTYAVVNKTTTTAAAAKKPAKKHKKLEGRKVPVKK